MLCELCRKNPASFYRVVPNIGKAVPVCPACLTKITAQGKTNFTGFRTLNEFGFNQLFDPDPDFIDFFAESPQTSVHDVLCPNCGFEFSGYSETGRLGCSKCYDVFGTQLQPIIQKIHGTTKHNGSRPK